MSITNLRKAVATKIKDAFEAGTVIRWTASGRYTYAAIKTPVGWYTTAGATNGFVPKQLTYDDLVEVLQRSESTDIKVATTWESV